MRLDVCKGRYIIRRLNTLTDKLAQDMATIADLADDDVLFEISHRALVSGWKAGCILWALNNQTWTKPMGELVEWLVYHDIWSKMQIFADLIGKDADTMRTCLTVCQTPSTRNNWKHYAWNWEKASKAPTASCANGCSASSSPTPPRRDSTPRPMNTCIIHSA